MSTSAASETNRRDASRRSVPTACALIVGSAIAFAAIGLYLHQIAAYVRFPADLLMWAETDFVGTILKLRMRQPLYGLPQDGNSGIYTPGAPILTYLLASLAGGVDSIPALRWIQLSYVLAATLIATRCTVLLRRLAAPGHADTLSPLWAVLSAALLSLAATSPEVNRYVHCLHADALALLVSVITCWLLLRYLLEPGWPRLLTLAAAPAVGYFVKQFLLVWIGVIAVTLIVSMPRRRDRWMAFGLIAIGIAAVVVVGCVHLWGDNFTFWTMQIMGGTRRHITLASPDSISIVRGVDHLLRAWPELVPGVAGGVLLLRVAKSPRTAPIAGLCAGWVVLVASETVTSGAGWSVLYHFGPSVVIGVAALLAALPLYWPPNDIVMGNGKPGMRDALAAIGLLAVVITTIVLLRAMPTLDVRSARVLPPRVPGAETYGQIAAIEREVAGLDPSRVLLDAGNWIYLPRPYLARYRVAALGDQPVGGLYDNFEPLLASIRRREFDKILVHGLHERLFMYDWPFWRRPSGVRQALLENYREIRVIPAMGPEAALPPAIMFRDAVSVLAPR